MALHVGLGRGTALDARVAAMRESNDPSTLHGEGLLIYQPCGSQSYILFSRNNSIDLQPVLLGLSEHAGSPLDCR